MAKVEDDGSLGGLTKMDNVRRYAKAAGAFVLTLTYSVCHFVMSYLPWLKEHATPITVIAVGGVAYAIVLFYETRFLGKAISPEQIPNLFPGSNTNSPPAFPPVQSNQKPPVFPPAN